MLKEQDLAIRGFIRVVDAALIAIAFFIAYYLYGNIRLFYKLDVFPATQLIRPPISLDKYFSFLVMVIAVWILSLNISGAYKSIRTRSFFDIVQILIHSTLYTVLAAGTLTFLFKIKFISRFLFALFMVIALAMLIAEKWLYVCAARYARKRGYNYRRLLIVGSGARAQNFIKTVEAHPEWGFRVSCVIDNEKAKIGRKVLGYEIVGLLEDLPNVLHGWAIDEVIFIVPRSWLDRIQNSIAVCELEGVKATLMADLFDLKIAHAAQAELEGTPLITFEPTLAQEGKLLMKRMVDIIVSATAIIALSPVFLLTAAAIKITSPGPVFFVQRRVGRNGRRFVLYKFRSMYYGSQKKIAELERLNEASGPVFKIKNDPRITPIGKVLRKFSIDELPQLFNVLMGCMSLVGPRPPLVREVSKYEPWQRRRLSMRPGLTCLWQVNGRNRVDFNTWMQLDLKYIDQWSLWLDFKILLKTIPAVVFGTGAH